MARRVDERVGIKDVAREAGVSIATVSNALNGTGRLSVPTRDRVVATADRLGYRPLVAARALAGRRTRMLALALTTYGERAVPYTSIPYYAEGILAATAAAHARGYLLVVVPGTSDLATWHSIDVDGVTQSEPRVRDPVRDVLLARGIPLVSDGRPFAPRAEDCWVDNDHAGATTQLLDHLEAAGARRIGAVLPRHDDHYAVAIAESYRQWCRQRRRPMLEEHFAVNVRGAETEAAVRLLDRGERVDAAFGIYSETGHALLEAAALCGRTVPRDLLVACFSEDPAYATTSPPVTTVSLQPRQLSAAAVDLLVDVIEGRERADHQLIVPTVLHRRSSTDPTPAHSTPVPVEPR